MGRSGSPCQRRIGFVSAVLQRTNRTRGKQKNKQQQLTIEKYDLRLICLKLLPFYFGRVFYFRAET